MQHPMISQHQWDMPTIGENHQQRLLREIREANVHHSDSVPPFNHKDCAEQVRNIDTYHRSKGWACIGYNRVICSHGYVYQGRQLTVVPAAAENHNEPIVAYCLLANNNPATTEQLSALWYIIKQDEKRCGYKLQLTTHREVEPPGYTQCPGNGIEAQVKKHRGH